MHHRLGKISCPIRVIQGELDEFATLAQVEVITETRPQARATIVSGCGHTPHIEAKELFVQEAREFLSILAL